MTALLLKALSFIVMIGLGFVLKNKGFFAATDQRVVSNIVLNITFPAAIITSFATLSLQMSLFSIIFIGIGCNLIMIGVGLLLSRGRSNTTRSLFMINMSGYNIGLFTIPFIQSFLGPFGVAVTSLFDIGNAILVTGGTFAIVSHKIHQGESNGLSSTLRTLRSSSPFVTYMAMLALALLNIRIPTAITAITAPIGAANPFLAMLMVGLLLEIQLDLAKLKKVATIVLVRLIAAAVFAAAIYFLLPFPLAVRQVLVFVVCSPLSGLAPLFTQRIGADSSLSSLAASITALFSIVIMTTLILTMGIGT
jgi:predicted permease